MKNLAYGLGILLVAILLYLGFFTNTGSGPDTGLQGKEAPDFEATTLDGRRIKLSDLRGKIVLLNFWATWCPPCREEMPIFVRVYRKYKNRGFEIVAVSTDSGPEGVRNFIKEFRINFPVVLDQKGKLARLYRVQGLPTSFLINREGKVVKVRLGEYKEIEKDLKKLL
ncbi:MAG: TlpA disulfide reductase family protein [Aquificota bacterium]|nr:TlpA disulfide reductase family protein [Aquificota bacterium]